MGSSTHRRLLLALVVASVNMAVHADVNCYSCTWTLSQPDTCVDMTQGTPPQERPCPTGFVCVVQADYYKNQGVIRTFFRGCLDRDSPQAMDGCTDSSELYTCQTACETELCNDGNGIPDGFTAPPIPTTKKPGNAAPHAQATVGVIVALLALTRLL